MVSSTLFNDEMLSDVEIKQIYNGTTRKSFAHKAIMCSQSSYFTKASIGGFKEASEPSMVLHDDDPVHFEFALKFMSTQYYDVSAIKAILRNVQDDKLSRVQFAKGLCRIAEKYAIERLLQPAADDLQLNLKAITDVDTLASIVRNHYEYQESPTCDALFGKLILTTLLNTHHHFMASVGYKSFCAEYPAFASDILVLQEYTSCTACRELIMYMRSSVEGNLVHCLYCSAWNLLPI